MKEKNGCLGLGLGFGFVFTKQTCFVFPVRCCLKEKMGCLDL